MSKIEQAKQKFYNTMLTRFSDEELIKLIEMFQNEQKRRLQP